MLFGVCFGAALNHHNSSHQKRAGIPFSVMPARLVSGYCALQMLIPRAVGLQSDRTSTQDAAS